MNSYFYVEANAFVLGKSSNSYKDKENNQHTSYSLNLIQNDGDSLYQMRVNESIYGKVEKGKEYRFICRFGTSKLSSFLQVTDVEEIREAK